MTKKYNQIPAHVRKSRGTPENTRTRDHVLPQCMGGRVKVVACFRCNNLKGDMTLEEFRIFAYGSPMPFYFETVIPHKLTS